MAIDGYLMIDDTVKVNTKNYPKVVQNTIGLLEKFDGEGDWVMYDGISSGFYALVKSLYAEGVISSKEFDQLVKRYGGEY